jgi:hypothetical protein
MEDDSDHDHEEIQNGSEEEDGEDIMENMEEYSSLFISIYIVITKQDQS